VRFAPWCVGFCVALVLATDVRQGQAEPGEGLGSQVVVQEHVRAHLAAQEQAVVAGRTLVVGLVLEMDEHWHTYWKHPGDSGLATDIAWTLPEGFEAHPIDWPAPDYFEVGGLASFAYDGKIVLPVRIEVPQGLAAGQTVTLEAVADWLVCREACIPGSAALTLTLPVVEQGIEPKVDPRWVGLFEWAAARTPVPVEAGQVKAWREGDQVHVEWVGDEPVVGGPRSRFYPVDAGRWQLTADQQMKVSGTRGAWVMHPMATRRDGVDRVRGVLVLESNNTADAVWVFQIDVAVDEQ